MKTVIVIPTYNEKDNLPKLVERIFSQNLADIQVVVVDDNSPDGTGRLADQLCATYPGLRALHRSEKGGLGPAYIAGFRHALAAGAELIMEMDADWSHDPKYLPDFFRAIATADVVLGSRYISGGGVSNWGMSRRLISRFGNIYARLILGMPYRDLTGGYKCFRRAVLEKIDLGKLSSVGYNFQIETTYRAHQAGFKIVEVPIVFVERAAGSSKFSLKIMLESFWKVLLLRFQR